LALVAATAPAALALDFVACAGAAATAGLTVAAVAGALVLVAALATCARDTGFS